jgi:aspartate/methionine/tyrosine aminotransferase
MTYHLNSSVGIVSAPPIAEAAGWLEGNSSNLPPINLSQAVPSYLPAPELADYVARCIKDGSANLYTDILGLPDLREALAAHMSAAYRGTVNAPDVAITAGCNQAFCAAVMALAKPGDNVVLAAPWYFNNQMWLEMQGIEVRAIAAIDDTDALPRPQDLAPMCDERTRAVVLISPNNPTGAVYPPELLDAFFDTCQTLKIALLVDETYKDFLDPASPPHNLFGRENWGETLVQLYSFSKVYALTGARVGSLIAGPQMIEAVEKIIDCVAICAPHTGQKAALFGLQNLDQWKQQKRVMMANRLHAMKAAFANHASNYRIVSAGAFFAYLAHPYVNHDARAVAMGLAQHCGVLTLPGSMFGPEQDGYLRLAFANVDASSIEDAAQRLGQYQPQV